MADVTMPRLSDTMQEGTIAKWLKQPGDPVQRGEILAQIETDKAVMDLQAYEEGILQEIVAAEGSTAPIGQVIARIGSGAASGSTAPPPAGNVAAPPEPVPAVDEAPAEAAKPPAPSVVPAKPSDVPMPPPSAPASAERNGASEDKVRASPLARRIAGEHGLDLRAVAGTGPEGRVVRADVEAALAGGGQTTVAAEGPPPVQADGDEVVPLSAMRRTIARRMAESTQTAPHFFVTMVVDATDLVRLHGDLEQGKDENGVTITINDVIVKAAALTLRKVPDVNVSYAGDTLIRRAHVNVGVAVAVERGLIVPVIHDADQKSVADVARETRALVGRARAGQLQPHELSGGTFSISNMGMFGVEQFSAIINPPEAAILAVGAATLEPAVHEGQIVPRHRLRLTLSCDHRAMDGVTGARFLQALKALLENPLRVLVG